MLQGAAPPDEQQLRFYLISLQTWKMDGRWINIREHQCTRRSRLGDLGGRREAGDLVQRTGRGQKPKLATESGVLGEN